MIHDDLPAIARLIRVGMPVNARDDHRGWAAIHYAAHHGRIYALKPLLDAKADPALKTGIEGWTPLQLAVKAGKARFVERLLNHGVRVDQPPEEGAEGLLQLAAGEGDLDMVE